jgi:hypothetical protein
MGLVAFALHALAHELAIAAFRLCLFAGAAFRRLLEIATELHFAENAFTLQLLLEGAQRLIDVIVADNYLYDDRPPRVRLWIKKRGL